MSRQNYLNEEPWTEVRDDQGIRSRVFARPRDATLGATLHELEPGKPGFTLHLHYGCEEMFFVVSGTPTLRDGHTEETLSPGDYVFCPQGEAGVHAFTNRAEAPARILAISAKWFPDVVAYPERGDAWVATRAPELEPDGPDKGIVARFELPRGGDGRKG